MTAQSRPGVNPDSDFEYPHRSIYEDFGAAAVAYPGNIAYVFYGRKISFARMLSDVEDCARSLKLYGIEKGDKVTIALPNCPQALTFFYAANKIGAVCNMLHPLSSEGEIRDSLVMSDSKIAITFDMFVSKFKAIMDETPLRHLVVTSVKDALGFFKGVVYAWKSRKIERVVPEKGIVVWGTFLAEGKSYTGSTTCKVLPEDPAVILHSGGTTGTSKGVLHCNDAFNAIGRQLSNLVKNKSGEAVLALMPVFHGFGIGVSVHFILSQGCTCVLMPRFSPDSYAKTVLKYRTNYLIGPPSMYEALINSSKFKKANLSFLKGVYSGGDLLTSEASVRLEKFLRDHGSPVGPQQGYGLAEAIAANSLEPLNHHKPGSIGVPLAGNRMKIVKIDTVETADVGEDGEICVLGPTVMLGYLDNPEETAKTLKMHPDGLVWLHTGDIGRIDEEGTVYFVQRLKRMIVTNGYNVYPSHIERVFDSHPSVSVSCVIGIPDEARGQIIKVFVKLNPGFSPSESLKKEYMQLARKEVARYAMPRSIEFVNDMPLTALGKVDFRKLEMEYSKK